MLELFSFLIIAEGMMDDFCIFGHLFYDMKIEDFFVGISVIIDKDYM